jgi:hypothetical protein
MSTHATHTHNFEGQYKKERCIEKKVTAGFVGSFGHKEASPAHEGDDDAPLQRKKPSERLKVSNRLSLFQNTKDTFKGCVETAYLFFFLVRRNHKLLLVLTSCARRLFASVIATFENRITGRPKMF